MNIETKIQNFLMRKKGINIDISFRCPLECPRCQRQTSFTNHGKKVYGYDLSLSEIDKLSNFYKKFDFCGQLSDPIHHPNFAEILNLLYKKNVRCDVHNAASQKSLDYYIKCWEANPNAYWIFAIDGLPKDSHKYRINQDGQKLFEIMCESKKYLKNTPLWQYIVFSYNENDVEEAKKLAKDNGVYFLMTQSSRWLGDDDPYKPKNESLQLDAKNKTE